MVTRKPVAGQPPLDAEQASYLNFRDNAPPSTSHSQPVADTAQEGPQLTYPNAGSFTGTVQGIAELPSNDGPHVRKDKDDSDSISDWADSDEEVTTAATKNTDQIKIPERVEDDSRPKGSSQQDLPSSLRIGNPNPLHVDKRSQRTATDPQNLKTSLTSSNDYAQPPHSPSSALPASLQSNNPFLKHADTAQSPAPQQYTGYDESALAVSKNGQQLPLRQAAFPPTVSQASASGHIATSAYDGLDDWANSLSSEVSRENKPHATSQEVASLHEAPPLTQHFTGKPSNPFVISSNPASQSDDTPKPPAFPSPAAQQERTSILDEPVPNATSPDATTGYFQQDDNNRPPINPSQSSNQSHALNTSVTATSNTEVETPTTQVRKQRNETYQIKNVRWFDSSSGSGGMRVSPVLTQNANGPCPLLALVNALVLSTPAGLETTLVQALKSREQVSLGLLLDAVFDELTSNHARRGSTAQNLPDVGKLYTFLITLHTGMNVNPRFVPLESQHADNVLDAYHGHVPLDNDLTPSAGTFENTKELQMYSTFAMPLIHGWLPEPQSDAARAFRRSAPSYEDAQNVQFRQEELEHKLQSQELESLSTEEQNLFLDLSAINDFFSRWPTQLTDYGLLMLNETLRSGNFAILFRNDHFSTVYKEPHSKQLMTLVTDQGYSTHEEIVWESLVDVNGTAGQFYSGDFRSVSHSDNMERRPSNADNNWTVVQGRGSGRRSDTANGSPVITGPPRAGSQSQVHHRTASEQEDHDLALALQLQEEEEERARRSNRQASSTNTNNTNARISSQPEIPPRRSNQANASPQRNAAAYGHGDTAPPPYELAAAGKPFYPPQGHPSNENAPRNRHRQNPQTTNYGRSNDPNLGRSSRRTARQSLIEQIPNNSYSYQGTPYPPRRDNYRPASPERGEKCVVM